MYRRCKVPDSSCQGCLLIIVYKPETVASNDYGVLCFFSWTGPSLVKALEDNIYMRISSNARYPTISYSRSFATYCLLLHTHLLSIWKAMKGSVQLEQATRSLSSLETFLLCRLISSAAPENLRLCKWRRWYAGLARICCNWRHTNFWIRYK